MKELNFTAVILMRNVTMQGIGKTLSVALNQGFKAANSRIKSASLRFKNMALMDVTLRETLETIPMESFDLLFNSDVLVDAVVEKGDRFPALAQDPAESIGLTAK